VGGRAIPDESPGHDSSASIPVASVRSTWR